MSNRSSIEALQGAPVGMGLAAVILGSVGLLLSFLPILGIPLSGIGLVFGAVGLAIALGSGRRGLRWPIGGLALSALGLAASLAIGRAPEGYLPSRAVPSQMQSEESDRPYVSPPARPGLFAPPARPGRFAPPARP
jgi:hypothetical protein